MNKEQRAWRDYGIALADAILTRQRWQELAKKGKQKRAYAGAIEMRLLFYKDFRGEAIKAKRIALHISRYYKGK